jgi:AcrR family transcriptional regulator
MSAAGMPRSDDPRARAARTKRDRTRTALLAAAERQFSTRGWARTRVEDIAADAGVSAATAYNHFPTKHALIGHVYRPLVLPLRLRAEQDVAAGRAVADALDEQVWALVRMTSRNRVLSGAFFAACQEYAARVHAPPRPDDELDPRTIAPLPDAIGLLVEHGQAGGELRAYPAAADISSMLANVVLLRGVEAPDEPAEVTEELVRTVLFGSLQPQRLPPL